MMAIRRSLASLSLVFALVTPALAQAPAIPAFTRFHAGGKDPADGGRLLLTTLHCVRCHGQAGAKDDAKPAVILDGIGARVNRGYLREFISNPHKVKPGTTMPDLFAGLGDAEKKEKSEALAHYLASNGTPSQMKPDRKAIAPGRDLFHKVGCVACHGTRDAAGGQDKLYATSVPLGDIKAKYTLAGLKAFLENPLQSRPHGRMPGILTGKEAGDVANYLLQGTFPGVAASNMKFAYYEGSWQALPDFTKVKPVFSGEAADFDLGVARRNNDCALKFTGHLKIETAGNYTFHVTSDDGSKLWIEDKLVVNNDGIHPPQLKSGKAKLAKGMHKLTLAVFNAGGGFELSAEIEGPGIGRQPLAPMVYLAEKVEGPAVDEKKIPGSFAIQPALVAKGKELFGSMGCANCHQLQDEAKRLPAPALINLKPAGGCLDATPKKGIPHYALDANQTAALRAALERQFPMVATAKGPIEAAMKSFNCYACHDRDKLGGVEDAVKPHFTATFKEWGDEASIPPSLTGVGAKLKPTYVKKILEQGAHDRTYMQTRMPKFGPDATTLIALFENADAAEKAPKIEFPEPLNKVKFAGRNLVGKQAFGCINCHNFGGIKTEGVQGIDLALTTERLKKEWYYNYMLNPNKYRPGTRMPTSFPEGQTPLDKVLDGRADTQIEAIWVYLSDGKAATPPIGMNKQSIPLIPVNEAIIYRNFIQGAGPRAIGVGFPERAHLAFDANDLRLAMIWQGLFIDARRHWTGRGEGFEPPMGDNILHLPTGVSFYVLANDDEAWPTKSAKDLGYKFKGYRLTSDQRPTFLYTFNDIKIEDTPNAIETKDHAMIRRTFMIYAEIPIGKLYYRAAAADKIEADKDGWYRINDWRMRIDSAPSPIIRKSGSKMELLVPIRFKDNNAKVVQEYQW